MSTTIDFWRWQNLIGLSLICVALPFAAGRKLPLSGKLLWVYCLLSPLFVFQSPFKYPQFALNFDQTTGQAFSQILLIPLGVLLIPPKLFPSIRGLLVLLGVAEACLVIFCGAGLMQARSFDTALMAAMIPVVVFPLRVLFLGTMLTTQGATAFLIVAAQMLAFLKGSRARAWFALPAFAGLAWLFQGGKLFESSGRIMFWKAFMKWWDGERLWITGSHIGIFEWLPRLVKDFQIDDRIFLQMHNDWLQVLFEGGAIGLAVLLWFYIELCYKAWSRPKLLATLFGIGAFMLTYHPLHFFLSAFFVAVVVREVLDGTDASRTI